MEDQHRNGFSTKHLMHRLSNDPRCPTNLRTRISEELAGFETLRQSQPARMSPGELAPTSSFIMRVEGLLKSGSVEVPQLARQINMIARSEAIHLMPDEALSLARILVEPKPD